MVMIDFRGLDSIVLALSGGIDSALLAYSASQQGIKTRLVHAWFDKPSSRMDMHYAKQIAKDLGLVVDIIDLSGINKMQLGYIPIEQALADELDCSGDPGMGAPTGFYVTAAAVAYYAQLVGIPNVVLGLIQEQTEGRSDLEKSLDVLAESINTMNPMLHEMSIIAPLIHLTKSDIIKEAKNVNLPIEKTWSCFSSGPFHCGKCYACKARINAFKENKMIDPTNYIMN